MNKSHLSASPCTHGATHVRILGGKGGRGELRATSYPLSACSRNYRTVPVFVRVHDKSMSNTLDMPRHAELPYVFATVRGSRSPRRQPRIERESNSQSRTDSQTHTHSHTHTHTYTRARGDQHATRNKSAIARHLYCTCCRNYCTAPANFSRTSWATVCGSVRIFQLCA